MTKVKQTIQKRDEVHKCSICGITFHGYGHNPDPFVHHGCCCTDCNWDFVIPYRILLARQQERIEAVKKLADVA